MAREKGWLSAGAESPVTLGGPDQGTGKIVIPPFAPPSRTAITTSGSGSISGNTATGNGNAVYNGTTTLQNVGGAFIGGNSSYDGNITW
ncbi:hypothetical protein AGMMS49546_36630 [Spirochaetia bacterium]|nr:hypothetical protein AGMMS49546_36630 [Spirochaetia bacterium]